MMSDPNTNHVEKAFRSLDLMVVQDIFPSETAFLAHVLLPAAASLEKDGSFTNSERRIQRIHKVIDAPGDARPDWEITSAVAKLVLEKTGRADAVKHWVFHPARDHF